MRRLIALLITMSLVLGLSACGAPAPAPAEGGEARVEVVREEPAQEPSSEPPAAPAEEPEDTSLPGEGEPAFVPEEEEVTLLDIAFYQTKEEALKAAGSALVETIDVEETEQENPLGWYYMVYTAGRDGVEVEYQKGYDTLTIGDQRGGFYPTNMEGWNSLNTGESVVAHVNVEWYPVFQLVADDSIYRGMLPLGWEIYTSMEENGGIPAPVSLIGRIINTPISICKFSEHLTDDFTNPDLTYGYYSEVEYFTADEDHPALQKRLNEMSKADLAEYTEGLGMLGLEAHEAYDRTLPPSYTLYHKDRRVSLCRADEMVFSWVDYLMTDLGDMQYRSVLGHNLNTRTGEDLTLEEVLEDVSFLPGAIEDQCYGAGYEDNVITAITELAKEAILAKEFISSEYFCWNLGYEGLWLHFNDSLSLDILSAMGGRLSMLLPYRDFPGLVKEKYQNIPAAYCYPIELEEELNEYYALDLGRDGIYRELALRPGPEEDEGEIGSMAICMDHKWSSLTEGFGGCDYDALVVHTASGDDYLYFCSREWGELGEITVYHLTGEVYYEDKVQGNVLDMYLEGDQESETSHFFMTDPAHFLMSRRDDKFGANVSYAFHGTNRNGTPYNGDEYYYYADSGEWLTSPRADLKAEGVDKNGDSTGPATIAAGTRVRAYRTNDWDALDVIDQEGKIYRLRMEADSSNPYGITLEGKAPDELFDGIKDDWGEGEP